ncbi:hypothetical protein FKM82_030973 [Ascaphus truei]
METRTAIPNLWNNVTRALAGLCTVLVFNKKSKLHLRVFKAFYPFGCRCFTLNISILNTLQIQFCIHIATDSYGNSDILH